jgi:hypothetical protein
MLLENIKIDVLLENIEFRFVSTRLKHLVTVWCMLSDEAIQGATRGAPIPSFGKALDKN